MKITHFFCTLIFVITTSFNAMEVNQRIPMLPGSSHASMQQPDHKKILPFLSSEWILVGQQSNITCVAWTPNGKCVASAGNDLIVWNVATGRPHFFDGHPSHVKCVTFSPDSKYIVSGCWGGQDNLIVWDSETGKKLRVLVGHLWSVTCVAWSPDGDWVVSGSECLKNRLILWDTATWQPHPLVGHSDNVNCVAWSPDGTEIASGSKDDKKNKLIVWTFPTIKPKEIVKNFASAKL